MPLTAEELNQLNILLNKAAASGQLKTRTILGPRTILFTNALDKNDAIADLNNIHRIEIFVHTNK